MAGDALDLARRSGNLEALGVTLLVRSLELNVTGRAQERLAVAEELVSAAPPDGWDGWRGGYEQRAAARIAMGDRAGFEADAAECGRMGQERRFWFYRSRAALWRVTSALLDGRFDDVDALAGEVEALANAATQTSVPQDVLAIQRARLAIDRGRLREAEGILLAILEHWPEHAVLSPMLASVHAELGEVDVAAGTLDRYASDDFRSLSRLLPGGLAYLAEVAASLGDHGRAAQVYDRFLPFTGQMVATGAVAHCPGAVDRYLGQLAATTGRLKTAEAHYEQALRMEEGMRSPPLLARTRYWYARMLLKQGAPTETARARQLLAESVETSERLGMATLARQAGALLRR
jgi:tetratricopeptide (TPR) repeat protein